MDNSIMLSGDGAEALRQELLNDAYAGTVSGLGAMMLDVGEIRRADADELKEIARRYGR